MRSTSDPLESLHAAHKALQSLNIPHGLIGGWAVIAWGRVRATRDVDWLAAVPRSRKAEIVNALSHLGTVNWCEPGEDDPIAGLIRIVPADDERPLIDIILASGAADRAALARCLQIELGKASVPAVGQVGRLDEDILREACASRLVLDRLALLRR